ncbi:isochorismate synthase [bacterium]|nr:isochorismate synthase [bacterium]
MRRVEESHGAAGCAIAHASRAIDAGIEPLSLLEALPSSRQFLWQASDSGDAVAAVGEAFPVRATGPERFQQVAAMLAAVLGESADGGSEGPVAVGGFAFDPDHRAEGEWEGFPSADWCLPRLAIVRRDGASRLVIARKVPSGHERDRDVVASLAEMLDRVAGALDRRASGRPGHFPARASRPCRFEVDSSGSSERFRRGVERILRTIEAGGLEKAVLSRTVEVRADRAFDALAVARRLLRHETGATAMLVRRGSAAVVGASPERLVRLVDGRIDVSVLAGTARRGGNPGRDSTIRRALRSDPKELREHQVVLRAVREALEPVAENFRAPVRPTVLGTPVVQHLWSPVSARLREGRGLFDVVAALHPTPAVCGHPRRPAAELLAEVEPTRRGWWSGGVGWCDRRGGEITVVLRSALLRGAEALLHAGAGIVAGSSAESEIEETRLKLRPMLAGLLEV